MLAAGYPEFAAGDIGGVFRAENVNGVGDVAGSAHAFERTCGIHPVFRLDHVRLDLAACNAGSRNPGHFRPTSTPGAPFSRLVGTGSAPVVVDGDDDEGGETQD